MHLSVVRSTKGAYTYPEDKKMRSEVSRRSYQVPTCAPRGTVERVTMGHGGSSWDGTCTFTQRGSGNDSFGPAVGHGDSNGNGNGGGDNNGCPV